MQILNLIRDLCPEYIKNSTIKSPNSIINRQPIFKTGRGFEWTFLQRRYTKRDFPGGAVVKSLPANARDTGSIPGLGRSHMPRSN